MYRYLSYLGNRGSFATINNFEYNSLLVVRRSATPEVAYHDQLDGPPREASGPAPDLQADFPRFLLFFVWKKGRSPLKKYMKVGQVVNFHTFLFFLKGSTSNN